MSTIARARKLFELRERSGGAQEDLARSVTTEMGKTIGDARAEVARMIEMVEAACAIPTTMQGRVLEDVVAQHRRRDDPPAGGRVRGDRAVQLPGDGAVLVPAVRDRVRQHVRPQALRAGAADPADRVRGAATRSGCRRASSTSSTAAARSSRGSSIIRGSTRCRSSARRRSRKIVYERAAQGGKRVQALGGAKNHMVVMPDAVIDKTVEGIIGSAFGAAGQRCMAGSVVVTVGEAHEQLIGPLVEASRALRVGDGLDEGSDVGPVISCAARDRIARLDRAGRGGRARSWSLDGRASRRAIRAARTSGRRSSTTSRRRWTSPRRRCSARCCA